MCKDSLVVELSVKQLLNFLICYNTNYKYYASV